MWPTILPIITLVLGALLTYVLSYLNDSRRSVREDSRRWEDELLSRAGAYLAATGKAIDAQRTVWTLNGLPESEATNKRKLDQLLAHVAAMQEHAEAHWNLLLVAPEQVKEAASALSIALTENPITLSNPTSHQKHWVSGRQELFVNVVKDTVGVPDYSRRKSSTKAKK